MIKPLAAVSCIALSSFALAGGGGVAGTRLGGEFATPSTTGTGVGLGSLAQMMLALAIVAFLLKWVLPRIAGKVGKKLVSSGPGGIQIEESAQFAGGSLYIVSARGRSLLISVAGTTVTSLADLTQQHPVLKDPFELALADAKGKPTPSAAELEARAALDRLSQLTGSHAAR